MDQYLYSITEGKSHALKTSDSAEFVVTSGVDVIRMLDTFYVCAIPLPKYFNITYEDMSEMKAVYQNCIIEKGKRTDNYHILYINITPHIVYQPLWAFWKKSKKEYKAMIKYREYSVSKN